MLNQNCEDATVDRSKSLSFFQRYYVLLKAHYFLCYSNFASIGPILNITLRSRGLSNLEISSINLVIPFLIFFTNPLIGFLVDHTHRFRLTFNVILGLATISFTTLFFLPHIKTNNIQAEMYQSETMRYSMIFCASKEFADRCSLRSQCGCDYQAICTLFPTANNFNESSQRKIIHFNFTMDSKYVEKEVQNTSVRSTKGSVCDMNYRVSIDETIAQYIQIKSRDSFGNVKTSSLNRNSKLAICEIKCSIAHLCDGSRQSNQIIFVLLCSFLFVIGFNFFANATTIGTSIGFATLHRSNLFGRQRVWGTIGVGTSAFVTSRLYEHFKTEYVYIFMFIITSILSIIVTSFIRLRSDRQRETKSQHDDMSVVQNLDEFSTNQNDEKTKAKKREMKNPLFNIPLLLPLMKKIDVIVFLSTTFLWGMSFGVIDPYLILYIDEISPCQSRSIAGYITLITATAEVVALFISHKLLKYLGTKISTILIFIAFVIRFSGYFFIDKPYFILPFETMHFFSFGILFVLITQEAFTIAPPDLAGTLQGIVYGVSFGLGRGVGLLVCLFIYRWMKKRYLFLIYAIFNLIGTVIYIFYCLLSKRRSSSSSPIVLNKDNNDVSKNVLTKFESNPNEEPLLLSTKDKK